MIERKQNDDTAMENATIRTQLRSWTYINIYYCVKAILLGMYILVTD